MASPVSTPTQTQTQTALSPESGGSAARARLRLARLQDFAVALARAVDIDDVLAVAASVVSAAFDARVRIVARLVVDGIDVEVVGGTRPPESSESSYALPIDVGDGRITGSLLLVRERPWTLDADDRALGAAMAAGCALAIERTIVADYVHRVRIDAETARAGADAADRSRREFLAVMSHELRTPLNAIAGYADLLELGVHGPITEQQREAVRRLQKSQRHLLGLINRVLNYTRVEAGTVAYDVAVVSVDEAIAASVALVLQQAAEKQVRLSIGEGASGVRVLADRERVEQVLFNLLSNAVTFTDRGGSVTLRVRADGSMGAIAVADTGGGIAPGQLERVFEPFVQIDTRLTRPHGGVGLGLSISRGLARGMGGDLTAESVLGGGSTFYLTLPLATAAVPEHDPAPAS